jgi:hypothetical protein
MTTPGGKVGPYARLPCGTWTGEIRQRNFDTFSITGFYQVFCNKSLGIAITSWSGKSGGLILIVICKSAPDTPYPCKQSKHHHHQSS